MCIDAIVEAISKPIFEPISWVRPCSKRRVPGKVRAILGAGHREWTAPLMRLFGYTHEAHRAESITPSALAEVTLCATPSELRKIAAFLESCADEMERMGAIYDHAHLSDRAREFESSPHFVVCPSEA